MKPVFRPWHQFIAAYPDPYDDKTKCKKGCEKKMVITLKRESGHTFTELRLIVANLCAQAPDFFFVYSVKQIAMAGTDKINCLSIQLSII